MKNKVSILFNILGISFSILLISIFMLSNLYAKYVSTGDGDSSGRVAYFVFNVNDNNQVFDLDLSEIKYPGCETIQTFTISNFRNGKVSEVSMKVSLELLVEGELPITLSFLKADEKICSFDMLDKNESTFKVDNLLTFAPGVVVNDTYKLQITWPANRNDISYSGLTTTVKIKFTATQIN